MNCRYNAFDAMKAILLILLIGLSSVVYTQTKTIHVFVALCDNEHQGIVPVPKKLGNGKDAVNNLYWGAAFGVKSYFKNKATDWVLIRKVRPESPAVLERLLYKKVDRSVYLLADAYDGEMIKACIEHFLKAANGQFPFNITHDSLELAFGGSADALAYVGHDGLMDFNVNVEYVTKGNKAREVIILACFGKMFFSSEMEKAGAIPLLWTTHLMAPEAYTLKAAIDGWILNGSGARIVERAAQAYNKYQKCGIKGARKLFTTGF